MFVLRMRRRCLLLPWLRSFCVPPLQDALRRMDEEVWALLTNFSSGRAPPPFSSKTSSSSSARRLGPPSPLSGTSSSVRPSRPQPSPGRPPRLQVPSEGGGLPQVFNSGSRGSPVSTEHERRGQDVAWRGLYTPTCWSSMLCVSSLMSLMSLMLRLTRRRICFRQSERARSRRR